MSNVNFNSVVSRIKTEIRRRVKNGASTISALDVANVMRSRVTGAARGAVVRRAFADLVTEGVLKQSDAQVYNPNTHHQVTVYSAH